jgi:hypothetical protein
MATMGDWRENKDEEIKLDGIGGVNIMVKADVHRSGTFYFWSFSNPTNLFQESISLAILLKIKPKPRDSPKWPNEQAMVSLDCRIMLSGMSILAKSQETLEKSLIHDNQVRLPFAKAIRRQKRSN